MDHQSVNLDSDSLDFKSNESVVKKDSPDQNSFLNLPKGTRNPFEDLNSVFGFTERNTPLGCVSDARTAPAGKTSLKK